MGDIAYLMTEEDTLDYIHRSSEDSRTGFAKTRSLVKGGGMGT